MGQPECIIAVQKMIDLYTLYTRVDGLGAWAVACKAYGLSKDNATKTYRLLHGVMSKTEPFFVSNEVMVELTSHEVRPPIDLQLDKDEFPAPFGFAYFNYPVVLGGGDEKQGIAAISWGTNEWTTIPGRPEEVDPGYIVISWLANMTEESDIWIPSPICHVPFRSATRDLPSIMCGNLDELDDTIVDITTLGIAVLSEMLLFTNQRLLFSPTPAHVGSLVRRKYHSVWKHEPTVKVVTLRAVDYVRHGERGSAEVDWHYRWKVRPHTRTLRDGRRITVKGYEKLRDRMDLPLKEYQATVFDVSR